MTFRSYLDVNISFTSRNKSYYLVSKCFFEPQTNLKKKTPNLNKMKKLSCRTLHVELIKLVFLFWYWGWARGAVNAFLQSSLWLADDLHNALYGCALG